MTGIISLQCTMKSNMKDRQYHDQDGCHSCAHVFILYDYEEGREYYCTFNAPIRPRCGSGLMEDERWSYDTRGFTKGMDSWGRWSKNREVQAYGICSTWFEKPEPLDP